MRFHFSHGIHFSFLLLLFETALRCVAVSLPAHANASGHRLFR
jgi:hypothetical protein